MTPTGNQGNGAIFFDPDGRRIRGDEWVQIYEQYYFVGGPTHGRRLTKRNQSSRFVEDNICGLLQKDELTEEDLKQIVAWKVGMIDHQASETSKGIKYLGDWHKDLQDRYGHSFARSISRLGKQARELRQDAKDCRYRKIFDLHRDLEGFDPVYMLTILFFLSHEKEPIYDKYADIAAQAINDGRQPGSNVNYRPLVSWTDYEKYKGVLRSIASECHASFVSRPIDRALWSYGHFFTDRGLLLATRSDSIGLTTS